VFPSADDTYVGLEKFSNGVVRAIHALAQVAEPDAGQ
jgi:hypothetical protein